MYDLEQFYAEQLIIISRDNIEPISFHDKLTEILDRLGKFLFRPHPIQYPIAYRLYLAGI